MSETTLTEQKRKTTADYKNLVAEMFAEISRLNEQMRQEEAEMEHLKIETDILKAEALRLKTETRTILARLEATL